MISYFGDTQLNVDANFVQTQEKSLLFVVPGQVFSWLRDERTTGYFVLFKKEFIASFCSEFILDFPFLKITEPNNYILSADEFNQIENSIKQLLTVFNTAHPYQEKMLQNLLATTLYGCKYIYDQYQNRVASMSRSHVVVSKFESLVEKMYIDSRNVRSYADLLNVTPDHLSLTVKNITGKSAKRIIKERLFLESKKLLKYSPLSISEIAYRLKFEEATHFTRFFKSVSKMTPSQFREH